jgi:hypothetical protein
MLATAGCLQQYGHQQQQRLKQQLACLEALKMLSFFEKIKLRKKI